MSSRFKNLGPRDRRINKELVAIFLTGRARG